MNLTTQQLQTLKAHIAANNNTIDIGAGPVAIKTVPQTPDNAFAIAVWYNSAVSPAFYVWLSSVSVIEIMQNGFGWDRVDNLTVGKARIWDFMTRAGTINPSRANVRAGFEACFSVESGDMNTRQAIYDHCQRPATQLEKLFAVGAGTASTHHGVGPATATVDGMVNYQDILNAWGS